MECLTTTETNRRNRNPKWRTLKLRRPLELLESENQGILMHKCSFRDNSKSSFNINKCFLQVLRIKLTATLSKLLLFKEIISQNKIKLILTEMTLFMQTISAQINLRFLKSWFHNLTKRPTEWSHDKWNLRKRQMSTIAPSMEVIIRHKSMIICKSRKHT